MHESTSAIRDLLARILDWEDAHVNFDTAVSWIPPEKRGARAAGFEHSPWELLEHLRIAQDDIVEFCLRLDYRHTMKWPDDYWPKDTVPLTDAAWNDSIAAYERGREQLKRLARDVKDLTAKVPAGESHHTFFREILLAADHAAYHVGQLVAVRRALGIWPPSREGSR